MKRKLFVTLLLIWSISFAQSNSNTETDTKKSEELKTEKKQIETKESKKSKSQKVSVKADTQKKVQNASNAVEIDAGVMFGEFQREDGPFLLKGNIIVPSGQVLKFGPGCQVYVGGKYTTITVFGQIEINGTAAEPVIIQSARENPNPWDWDRIYVRSRRRSTFNHVIIRHSNYGIVAENSSVYIKNSIFEKNSIHGLVVKNSNVRISNSEFRKGHVVSVLLQAGADVSADSITVKSNRCGIACGEKAFLVMKKGRVTGNRYGIAVDKGASVEIVAADITKNSVGIMSLSEIPKKTSEMVYQNGIDLKIVSPEEFAKLLKAPEDVKSVALPTTKKEIVVGENFTAGFSALKQERIKTASFIGNVSIGANYYRPDSKVHPTDRDTIKVLNTNGDSVIARIDSVFKQSKYAGEHEDEWYAGLTPKLMLFAQGKKGDLDVNVNADIELNSWYGGKIWDEEKQLLVDTLIETTVVPVVNDTDTTYTTIYDTSYSTQKAPFKFNTLVLNANFRDQNITLGDFYENISETSISSRKLRGLKYTGSFWNMGRGNKRIDVHLAFGESEAKEDIGDHDKDVFGDVTDTSYSTRQQMTYVASGNLRPTHNLTLTARGLIAHDQNNKPLISDAVVDDSVAYPISAATGGIGFDLKLLDGKMSINAELNVGKDDTLWLGEVDSGRTADTAEHYWDEPEWYKPQMIPALQTVFSELADMFQEKIAKDENGNILMDTTYDEDGSILEIDTVFKRSHAFAVSGGISGDAAGFDLSSNFHLIGDEYYSAGNPYLENDRLLVDFGAKKEFSDQLSSSLTYEFERTSLSDSIDPQNGVADPLNSNSIDLMGTYSFGESMPTIVADYGLQIQSNEDVTDTLAYQTTIDTIVDTSATVYDTTIDTVEVPVAYDFIEIINSGGIELKQRFENGIDFSIKYNFKNTNDASVYKIESENDLGDIWEHGIKAKFGFKVKRILRSKTSFKIKFKNEVEDDKAEIDWKITENLKFDIIPRKLKFTLKGDLRSKFSEEDNDETSKRDRFETLQKTLEGELKYIINSKLSATLSAKLEDFDDDVSGSTENYTLQSGGLHFIYLF